MKKAVRGLIRAKLQRDLDSMLYDILGHKREMKRLVEKQTILKRSRAELAKLIRLLD